MNIDRGPAGEYSCSLPALAATWPPAARISVAPPSQPEFASSPCLETPAARYNMMVLLPYE